MARLLRPTLSPATIYCVHRTHWQWCANQAADHRASYVTVSFHRISMSNDIVVGFRTNDLAQVLRPHGLGDH